MALVQDQPDNLPTTDTLANLKVNDSSQALQLPAIEATFVKFNGTSGELIDHPPARGEERTYIVKAKCRGYDIRDRADGEDRIVAVMEIDSCFERGRVPIVDEAQPSLYSVPADEDSAGGDDK